MYKNLFWSFNPQTDLAPSYIGHKNNYITTDNDAKRTVMFISAATDHAVFYLDEVRISADVDENP